MLVKIEGHPDLMKDTNSGAVLKVDKTARDEYLRKRELINSNKKMQQDLVEVTEKIAEIDEIKKDVQEIKAMLKELITK